MRENAFQAKIIKRLRRTYPEALILKNDSSYLQGVPDLLVLIEDAWFALEVKASPRSARQPNQEYYVERMNQMSFAAFIFPENETDVFDAIQRSLQARRAARCN